MLMGRQASLGELAGVASGGHLDGLEQINRKTPKSKASAKKKIRSKRCRSLLMLSSPFLSSGGVKSSLMSLLNPGGQCGESSNDHQLSPPIASPSTQQANLNSTSPPRQRVKCVKMKLFEQPLDKLCSPKSIKQLNEALDLNFTPQKSPNHLGTLGKRKRNSLTSNLGAASNLRRLSDQSHQAQGKQQPDANNSLSDLQRQQMLLAVLPQPIKSLLSELYLRGPSTVGIFRKSPNAKHCKELRQKLESDSTSSIEQFQVAVIASVFKEWLRSLPDCLLMSRLYPQWMDAARLIEPLHQEQQRRLHLQHLEQQQHYHHLGRHQSVGQLEVMPTDDGDDHNDCNVDRHNKTVGAGATPSLRPSRSPLTDNGAAREPLDRARSCSTMDAAAAAAVGEISINSYDYATNSIEDEEDKRQQVFALRERHSECLRIVRQLLDNLNQSNLILLRAFVCVLWHIAENSHLNKMSATNLGVCVGQSLLNDDQGDHRHDLLMDFQPHGGVGGHHHAHSHQQTSSSSASKAAALASSALSATKRHRRSRSQCLLLSSSLSLSQPSFGSNHLDSSSAQETAKYVPMLVAFIIENAPALFGQDVVDAFAGLPRSPRTSAEEEAKKDGAISTEQHAATTPDTCSKTKMAESRQLLASSSSSADSGIENHSPDCSYLGPTQPLDHRNHHHHERYLYLAQEGATCNDGGKETLSQSPPMVQPRQQIVVHHNQSNQRFATIPTKHDEPDFCSRGGGGSDSSTREATSILIVNHQTIGRGSSSGSPMKEKQPTVVNGAKHEGEEESGQQQRPQSATESTSSSSRASSSTSGLHSESPAFSSEVSDRTSGLNHRLHSSPSPSSVSSPSSASRSSPAQEEEHNDSDSNNNNSNNNNKDNETKENRPELLAKAATALEVKSIPDDRQPLQHQINSQNRYSTFMGVLNRVPKIPVQFTTSSYGGEAVIYNPRPSSTIILNSKSYAHSLDDGSIVFPSPGDQQNKLKEGARAVPNVDSVISVQPNEAKGQFAVPVNEKLLSNSAQQQYYSVLARNQHELREQRLKEFLAHQSQQLQQQHYSIHHHQQHLMTQQLPSVSQQQTTTRPSTTQHHNRVQQFGGGFTRDVYLQHHQLQQQHQQHPVFYSAASLNSLQQLQQQDRYLLYHRASLTPQRSHVMSLRDYYLSLQQQSQQPQQQHQNPTHQRLHHTRSATAAAVDRLRSAQATTVNASNNKLQHQSSHQPTSQLSQQNQRLIVQRQYSLGSQPAEVSASVTQEQNLITASRCLQARPQARLAKIRQNQFNGLYVRGDRQQPQSLPCKQLPPSVAGNGLASVAPTSLTSAIAKAGASSSSAASGPSSLDQSSNESLDDYMNDWMESTMV